MTKLAFTPATQDELYQFFAVAFGAAPGVTYMAQLNEAANAGLPTQEIVNIFTTKSQFTDVYPTTLSSAEFAVKLVNAVVGNSATVQAKASAVDDIVSALALPGWTRGDVIFAIFTNLASKPASDPDWAGTSKKMANQVIYARYYTEVMKGDTTDLPTLQKVIAGVTAGSDTSSGIEQSITTALNSGTGTGALNGCTLQASEALRTGNRFVTVFKNDVFGPEASSGEFTTETVVEGGTTFEGQSAIRVSTRTRGVQQGETLDITAIAFEQIAENGLSRNLGSEVVVPFFTGSLLTLRTVNTPPFLNNEFTLQPGQSIDQTITSTSTYINAPFPLPPTTDTGTLRSTYEARETISVLGRSYDTCRYKITGSDDEVSFNWYIFGIGLPARIEARNAAGAVLSRSELKSAVLNGTTL